ncbi:MAG TPA: O-antigen ligase family protein [Candidatus Saccharimonadales bacterium]|nr:O-antigen ligase family protein [Candidatus Saccharimonadales bacterium]
MTLTYIGLLLAIVIGQIFRLPIRPGSDLALRAADIVMAGVTIGWLVMSAYRWLITRKLPTAQLQLADKLFLAFQIILPITFLLNFGRFTHHDLLTGFGYLLRLEGYLMLYWVARSWGRRLDPTTWKRYFVWSAVIVAVLGFVQLGLFGDFRFMTTFGWDPHVGRLLSTFYDPNFVAIYLGLGLIGATAEILFGGQNQRKWYYPLGLILLVALYLTFSRSGVISVGIAMVLLGLRKNWKIGLLIAAIFAVVMFLPGRAGSRFISIFTSTKVETITDKNGKKIVSLVSGDQDTGAQRILSWKRAIAVIKSSPFYGVGYNNFGPASVQTGGRKAGDAASGAAQASDSSLLDIWATTGLIGLGVFLVFAWQLLRRSLLVSRKALADPNLAWRAGFGFGLLALGIDATFVNSLLYPQLLIYWLLFAGILVSFTAPTEVN